MSNTITCDGCGEHLGLDTEDHILLEPQVAVPTMGQDARPKHFHNWTCLLAYVLHKHAFDPKAVT